MPGQRCQVDVAVLQPRRKRGLYLPIPALVLTVLVLIGCRHFLADWHEFWWHMQRRVEKCPLALPQAPTGNLFLQ